MDAQLHEVVRLLVVDNRFSPEELESAEWARWRDVVDLSGPGDPPAAAHRWRGTSPLVLPQRPGSRRGFPASWSLWLVGQTELIPDYVLLPALSAGRRAMKEFGASPEGALEEIRKAVTGGVTRQRLSTTRPGPARQEPGANRNRVTVPGGPVNTGYTPHTHKVSVPPPQQGYTPPRNTGFDPSVVVPAPIAPAVVARAAVAPAAAARAAVAPAANRAPVPASAAAPPVRPPEPPARPLDAEALLSAFRAWLGPQYLPESVRAIVSRTRKVLRTTGSAEPQERELLAIEPTVPAPWGQRWAWSIYIRYCAETGQPYRPGRVPPCTSLEGKDPPFEVQAAMERLIPQLPSAHRQGARWEHVRSHPEPHLALRGATYPLSESDIRTLRSWGKPANGAMPLIPAAPGSATPMPAAQLRRLVRDFPTLTPPAPAGGSSTRTANKAAAPTKVTAREAPGSAMKPAAAPSSHPGAEKPVGRSAGRDGLVRPEAEPLYVWTGEPCPPEWTTPEE